MNYLRKFMFVFGYDSSSDTYKVVALSSTGSQVRVFSLGVNDWRKIQIFPPGILRIFHQTLSPKIKTLTLDAN